MIVTPLISKVRKGTFITFEQAKRDFNMNISESKSVKFSFSKYVLLDIPNIEESINSRNTVQFRNIEGNFTKGLSNISPSFEADRLDLSNSLQNYLLNMETLNISRSDYNPNVHRTTSERLFWKWLKELGVIRFRSANADEKNTLDNRYVEEDEGSIYNKVVKYIGEIDLQSADRKNGAYELYFLTPSESGSTPNVLFKSVSDENYGPGMAFRRSDNQEFIQGRSISDEPTPAGLTISAFYDKDVLPGSYEYEVNGSDQNPMWFDGLLQLGINSYFTDPEFGNVLNDTITRKNGPDEISYVRSRFDGACIDFDIEKYKIAADRNISSFGDFNNVMESASFKFNVCLLYYDLIDITTDDTLSTNLFGILILDDIKPESAGVSRIGSMLKVKPDTIGGIQGNGYGFRFNLKSFFNDDPSTADIDVSINDYQTFSMQLFADMMSRLSITNNYFEKILMDTISLKSAIDNIESYILTDTNKEMIMLEISDMRRILNSKTSNEDLRKIIENQSDTINSILSGRTSVGIDFFLDIITKNGIKAALDGRKLTISNESQKYNSVRIVSLQRNNTIQLMPGTNMIIHRDSSVVNISGNCTIFIDDSSNKWERNQTWKLKLLSDINLFGFNIIFRTTSPDFNTIIGSIPSGKPEVEIICINPDTKEFILI